MVGLSEKQHLAEAPWQRRTVGVAEALAEAPGRGARRCVSPWHPPWHPTVDVPWQRQRWVSLWQRRRRQRWVSPGRGAWQRRPLRRPRRWVSPWQRRLAFDGGCLHGRSAGVRRWVSHGRPNGGCPMADPPMAEATAPTVGVPWQRRLAEVLGGGCPHGTHQRWVSLGRGAWRSTVGVPMAEAPAFDGGCPMADPLWQRRRRSRRRRQRWVSWQRRLAEAPAPPQIGQPVGVPWQRRLAFDGGCPHGRSAGVRRWVSHGRPNGGCPMADPPMAEAPGSTVGVPWQRRLAFDGGCPMADPTVGVPWQTHNGGCPLAEATTVDVLWQRQKRMAEATVGVPMAAPWQRPTVGVPMAEALGGGGCPIRGGAYVEAS